MLGETVGYINCPGLALMRGVKALREGRIYEKREREGWGRKERQSVEKEGKRRQPVTSITALSTSLHLT